MAKTPANSGKLWAPADDRQLKKEAAGNTRLVSSAYIRAGRRVQSGAEPTKSESRSSRPTKVHMERKTVRTSSGRRLAGAYPVLSQEAAAVRCGIHWTQRGEVERGQRSLRLETIVNIAAELRGGCGARPIPNLGKCPSTTNSWGGCDTGCQHWLSGRIRSISAVHRGSNSRPHQVP